jgi:hypothetical protein
VSGTQFVGNNVGEEGEERCTGAGMYVSGKVWAHCSVGVLIAQYGLPRVLGMVISLCKVNR